LLAAPVQNRPTPISQPPRNRLEAPLPPDAADPFLVDCFNALTRGEVSRGEQACTLALIANPRDPDALELRGYAYLLQHSFELAAQDFRLALSLTPDNAEDRAGYGQSLVGLQQYPQAVEQFVRAVALAPRNAPFRNGLCFARAASGKDLDVALGDCDTALLLAPDTPAPFASRGLVKLRLGWYAEAIEDYTTSLAKRPAQPTARFGRGLAHLALRQTAAGVEDIQAARTTGEDVDATFIAMGLLPKDCAGKGKVQCPPGFPKMPTSNWLLARLFFWR
jgi:tetratricopeptide (TPR) repeat protein